MPKIKGYKAKNKRACKERNFHLSKKFVRLRGMKDILFNEYKYWDIVRKKAAELAKVYGFKEIETPVMENLALYEKAIGKTSNIIAKEMYSFQDKSGETIALRPEATSALARAYIENGMFRMSQPVKMFWFGSIFRYDKSQTTSYRQSHQFDLEIFGEEGFIADFLLILIAYNFFKELQINVQVQINSLGCEDCRKEYLNKLLEFYKGRGKRSKLCDDCRKKILKNPLQLLNCKENGCVEAREGAPQIVDYLCDNCKNHFIKVLEYLDESDVPYNLNPYFVRDFDYYNRTIFEFCFLNEKDEVVSNDFSLGAGGRYDDLVESMGGESTAGCGFAIGLEKVIMKIKENNIPIKQDGVDVVFVAQLGEQARIKIIALFEELRRSGYNVRQSFTKDGLRAQLEEAVRIKAKYALILGQKEVLDGTILIRDMESGIQEIVDYEKVVMEIDKRIKK